MRPTAQTRYGSTAGNARMNTRRTRALLWFTTAGLLATAVAVVVLNLMLPPVIDSSTQRTPQQDDWPVNALASNNGTIDQAELIEAAHKNIRQTLFDPPVVIPKPPPPKPLPPIELISTILPESGEPSAWVADGQNTRKVKEGDRLGPEDNPVIVSSITSGRLTVEHEAKQVQIERTPSDEGRQR